MRHSVHNLCPGTDATTLPQHCRERVRESEIFYVQPVQGVYLPRRSSCILDLAFLYNWGWKRGCICNLKWLAVNLTVQYQFVQHFFFKPNTNTCLFYISLIISSKRKRIISETGIRVFFKSELPSLIKSHLKLRPSAPFF